MHGLSIVNLLLGRNGRIGIGLVDLLLILAGAALAYWLVPSLLEAPGL